MGKSSTTKASAPPRPSGVVPRPPSTKKSKTNSKGRRSAVAALERTSGAASSMAILGGETGAVDRSARIAAGKALRKVVPRDSHGDWAPSPERIDPVTILQLQARSRVADLIPIRYGRMMESAFGFFRGAAAGMAADLASSPVTGLMTQACGDAHLLNFGAFGTPERRLIFDVNDFDESLPAPWEIDLKRLAASFMVASRSKDLPDEIGAKAILGVVRSYASSMQRFAGMRTLDAWYSSVDADRVTTLSADLHSDADTEARVVKAISRARSHDLQQAIGKLTEVVDGRRRIVDQLPLIGHVPGADEMGRMQVLLSAYRESLSDDHNHLLDRYQLVDAAARSSASAALAPAAGSRCSTAVGATTRSCCRSKKRSGPCSSPSGARRRTAARGVASSRASGSCRRPATCSSAGPTTTSPVSTTTGASSANMKFSVNVAAQPTPTFLMYGDLCGVSLARAHARAGDAAALSGYLGKGDELGRALGRFAVSYADQNALDHEALVQAVADGHIEAIPGV